MSELRHAPRTLKPASRLSVPRTPSPLARAGMASGGQALDRHTQASMSTRFGHDFSSVRVHTDARAEDAAAMLGANAFAHGADIVFGAGQYSPGSPQTERLLAHELAHVAQQDRFGSGDRGRMSDRGDESEREADRLASQVTAGRAVDVQAHPGAALARDERDAAPFSMMDPGAQYGMLAQPKSMLEVPPSSPAAQTPPWMKHMGQIASLPSRPAAAKPSGGGDGMSAYDVATDNSLGTAVSTAASLAGGTRMAGSLGFIDKASGPLGMYSNAVSFGQDIRDGNFSGAVVDAAGFGGASVATAGAAGLIETGAAGAAINPAMLSPWGAAMGSFAGGYVGGTHLLGAANDYAKSNAIYGHRADGEARDSTEAAADAGHAVDDAISDFDIGGYQLPGQGFIGGVAGGLTATAGSLVTAGYSGLHAAFSGPSYIDRIKEAIQQEEDADDNQKKSDASWMEEIDKRDNPEQ